MRNNQFAPLIALLCLTALLLPAHAQLHPPEFRSIFPLGGRPGATTRVTISGLSFRGATQIVFDRPGITAKIVGTDPATLPNPTPESDGNPSIVADFTLTKDVMPGLCRFRVISAAGASSLCKWLIGRDVPEVEDKKPNDTLAKAQMLALPAALNGRINAAGDRAFYAFDLAPGQTFVAEVAAALVDSPFDSMLVLRDADGRQVASNDDFNSPDSLLTYTAPKAGRYTLMITSSVGSGGGDQTYRLTLGYLPHVTAVFPMSVQTGKGGMLTPIGVNVPAAPMAAPTASTRPGDREPVRFPAPQGMSNPVSVYLTPLTVVAETEPNDTRQQATALPVPGVADGRFWRADGKEGADVDFYRFRAEAGKRYILDVQCQAVGSPADPVLTLFDSEGRQLEENDDSGSRDARIDRTFDKTGDYYLRIREVAGRTAPYMVYRLVAQEPPPPGFSLAVETRSRGLGRGDSMPLEVAVDRDRWDGPVTLTVENLPQGVTASSCVVPAGVPRGLIVLTADVNAPMAAFPLRIVGTAQVDGKMVTQVLQRANDWMYRGGGRALTTAPSDMITLAVGAPYEVAPKTDVKELALTRGQSIKVKVRVERRAGFKQPVTLRALGLPDGVTAADVAVPADKAEAELELKATAQARLGTVPITLDCVASNPQYKVPGQDNVLAVQLDRVTPPVSLTVNAPPK